MSLPQPRIYRLRKCDSLFFLETPPFLRPEIPHCEDISRNFELMQFLLQQAAVRDNKPWPSTTRKMVDAALRLKRLPTPRLGHSHTFEISANLGYFGVTGQALLMSPKGRNASRDNLVILVVAVCLLKFACYFVTYCIMC